MIELKSGVPLVRALDRGLLLLAAFTPEKPQQSLNDLARAAALDKGTTRRLLQTLIHNKFVFHNEANGEYSLGARILNLASAVQVGGDLRSLSEGVLRDVAARSGATSFLWMYDDGMALCLDRVRMKLPDVEAVWFSVGGRTSLNAGAGPRVLLAFIDDAARQQALRIPLSGRTPRAETNPTRLNQKATQIRQRRWDFASDDFVIGLSGLGVPIQAPNGKLFGALSISTVTAAFGDAARPAYLEMLREAAEDIGTRMSAVTNARVD